jgi:hypothetical protein
MMGERRGMQEALFYGFSRERHVPDNHLAMASGCEEGGALLHLIFAVHMPLMPVPTKRGATSRLASLPHHATAPERRLHVDRQ